MDTVVVSARIDPVDASKLKLLAALRNVKRQDVISAGIQRELRAAPELPEVERLIANGYGQDDEQ